MVSDPDALQGLIAAAIAGFAVLGGFMAFFSGLAAAVGLVVGEAESWFARNINHAIGAGFIAGLPLATGAAMIEFVL